MLATIGDLQQSLNDLSATIDKVMKRKAKLEALADAVRFAIRRGGEFVWYEYHEAAKALKALDALDNPTPVESRAVEEV